MVFTDFNVLNTSSHNHASLQRTFLFPYWSSYYCMYLQTVPVTQSIFCMLDKSSDSCVYLQVCKKKENNQVPSENLLCGHVLIPANKIQNAIKYMTIKSTSVHGLVSICWALSKNSRTVYIYTNSNEITIRRYAMLTTHTKLLFKHLWLIYSYASRQLCKINVSANLEYYMASICRRLSMTWSIVYNIWTSINVFKTIVKSLP